MKKLLLIVSAVIALNADFVEDVCELYKNDISEAKCAEFREGAVRLVKILPRLTKKERCKVLKESMVVFEIADNIIEGKYKRVEQKPLTLEEIQKQLLLEAMKQNGFIKRKGLLKYDDFADFLEDKADLYDECVEGEEK